MNTKTIEPTPEEWQLLQKPTWELSDGELRQIMLIKRRICRECKFAKRIDEAGVRELVRLQGEM